MQTLLGDLIYHFVLYATNEIFTSHFKDDVGRFDDGPLVLLVYFNLINAFRITW